jgi:hypothetical protein
LTTEQLEALQRFARANGRYWKAALRNCWMIVQYPGVPPGDVPYLHLLRNSKDFGPNGLIKFRIKPEEAKLDLPDGPPEHPHR